MASMQLAKIIRERKGLNPWQMRKLLGRSIQSYLNFERSAKKVTLSELVKLYEISELTLDEFWLIVKAQARDEIKKKAKKNQVVSK